MSSAGDVNGDGFGDLSFNRVVGGNGTDTLRIDGTGLSLDLTMLKDNRLLGIEKIDLRGTWGPTH